MADNKRRDNQKPKDHGEDPLPGDAGFAPEPDLGFAGEAISSPLFGKLARRRNKDQADIHTDFVPEQISDQRATPPKTAASAGEQVEDGLEDPETIGKKKTWVPTGNATTSGIEQPDDAQPDAAAETDANDEDSDGFEKTWVPSMTPTVSGIEQPDDDQPDAAAETDANDEDSDGFEKTWVPSMTPTVSGIEQPDDDQPDAAADEDANDEDSDGFEKTWVPSMTPTVSGIDLPDDAQPDEAAEADANDEDSDGFAKTWVPSMTPTVSGIEQPDDAQQAAAANEDADDEDADGFAKTWVPSKTPTVSGIELPDDAQPGAGDEDADGFEKTWVPSKTPTHHDFGISAPESHVDDDGGEDADPNKTFVPSRTPTFDGTSGDYSSDGDSNDDVFKKTDVMGTRPARTSAKTEGKQNLFEDTVNVDGAPSGDVDDPSAGTMIADIVTGFEKTEVFSQSIGMRGLSEDEYQEWQKEVAEKSVDDTDPGELLPEVTTGSGMGRRTQIWSKQSGNGLTHNLTIRSRPVAGADQFRNSSNSEKPDYEIVEKLAEGGMGAIYIAKQTSLDRELAIKTLKPLKQNEKKAYTQQGRISQVEHQRREMFLSEALVTANLVHPHIIPIHDLCQTDDGFPFYSMKRVHGTPWNELIRTMSLEENLEVLHKACDAMAYAHQNGVVNRDLKPENIMLGEFGEVLVLDWGLAVPASAADKKRFASPAASFGAGTPAYMSPELWTGPPEAIGPWSDIYLLGAILFEAITGDSPHTFPEPDSKRGNSGLWVIIDSVVRKNEIRKTNHKGELMDIALKAMATDPRNRHKSVIEFQEAVKNFQRHEESRRLSEIATKTFQDAEVGGERRGYQNYQTAAALFEQAFVAWPENAPAVDGLKQTRLAYAQLAHQKGDYDLGLQIACQEQGQEFTELTSKLSRSKRIRNGLKYATAAAACLIVIATGLIFQQSAKIVAQNESLDVLKQEEVERTAELAQLEDQRKLAVEDAEKAQVAKAAAEEDAEEARVAKAAAEEEAEAARVATREAQAATEIANAQTEEAKKATEAAEEKRKEAVAATALAVKATELAVKDKVRVEVEKKNSEIANLVSRADYAAALQRVDELLNSLPEMKELPDVERNDRITELQARKQQLLKRTERTDAPVQAQVISPSGRIVILGDTKGLLTAWKMEAGAEEFPDAPLHQLKFDNAVSQVAISDDESLVVAATGTEIYLWNPQTQVHEQLTGHQASISTIAMAGDTLLSADSSGVIMGWSLKAKKSVWKMRSSSSIRSVALMPRAGIFLYAGSRGGESSDVLAYRLPSAELIAANESSSQELRSLEPLRPERLGQLRFPRDRSDPPNRICVSPDEQILVISNSRNGDLIALPRNAEAATAKNDRFPFVHAADLQAKGFTGWVSEQHKRPVNDIQFSTDGSRVVTASDDRTIGIWKVAGATVNSSDDKILAPIQQMLGHGAKVNAAGFLDAVGNYVLSASADQYCRFWNVNQYERQRQDIEAAFAPEEKETTRVDKPVDLKPSRFILTSYAESSDARSDASGTQPASNGEYVQVNANAAVQRGSLNAVAINDDGSRIVTGATDGTAVIWDTQSGSPIAGGSSRAQFVVESASFEEGHDFNVARLRFLPPDGRILMTTGFDGNLCLWNSDLSQSGVGAQEVRLPGLGIVNAIAPSSDGVYLAASMAAGVMEDRGVTKIWKTQDILQSREPSVFVTLSGYHQGEVSAVAFSADGQLVATGARDGRVAVWALSGGKLIAGGQLHAKNTIISHMEWLPDGDLITAGFDGRLQRLNVDLSAQRLTTVTRFEHDRIPI